MEFTPYVNKYGKYFTENRGSDEDWYKKKIPHRNTRNLIQFITFRLADSLPQYKIEEIEKELELNYRLSDYAIRKAGNARRKLYEHYLDQGFGACSLGNEIMAKKVFDALIFYDNNKYELIAWSIMPNHVHTLIRTIDELGLILQLWKSYTGKWAIKNNKKYCLGLKTETDRFWMKDYWDRYMRNEQHFINTIRYILDNPKKANLPQSHPAYSFTGIREVHC